MIQAAFSGTPKLMQIALVLSTAGIAQSPKPSLTASVVMQRVIAASGATPPANSVDTFKAGDPNTVVTGIVTTFMDTYPVLEKAVAAGKNLIITHEPTFYNHLDDQAPLAADPVEQQKLAYIRDHHLVVCRFHDTWNLRQPDGILAGMIEEFGWKAYQSSANPHLFTFPSTTVEQIAARIQASTRARAIRIVGDPAMQVTGVALLPGHRARKSRSKRSAMALLQVAQYVSPSSSFLNNGAYEGAGQIGYVGAHVRASGTFSFGLGSVRFALLAAAFIFYGMVRKGIAKTWLLWAAAFALLLSIPMIGARGLVYQLLAMLGGMGIAAMMGVSQFGSIAYYSSLADCVVLGIAVAGLL